MTVSTTMDAEELQDLCKGKIQWRKTDAEIDADIALVRRTDFKGLPTTWINDQKVLGPKPSNDILAAIEAASQGEASGRGPGLFLGFLAFIAGLLGMSLRHGLPKSARASEGAAQDGDEREGDSATEDRAHDD